MEFLKKLSIAYFSCSIALARASCDTYDLETVYGAYNFLHSVESFHYAIDTESFDMVVGG